MVSYARNVTHGLSKTPEYNVWTKMKQRCLNPKDKDYQLYGAAGITVCQEWIVSFEAFYRHIGPRPAPKLSIDRIDGTKGYFPGNVRWATAKQQSENRPGWVKDLNGKTVVSKAEEIGIPAPTIYNRIRRGMTSDRVITAGRLKTGFAPTVLVEYKGR